MSDLDVRPVTGDEFPAFSRACVLTFGDDITDEKIARSRTLQDLDRTLAAFDDGAIVATTALFSLDVSVPGGAVVPMAGCTAVGVQTTHRRRGLLTALMRRQLDDVHDHGEAIAGLWASESPIYGRFGYGVATRYRQFEVARAHGAFRPDVAVADAALRLVDAETAIAIFPGLYEQAATRQGGMVVKPEPFWRAWLGTDDADDREGASPRFHLLLPDRGFAIYRHKPEDVDGVPAGVAQVITLVAVDDEAEAALWRHCLDIDLTNRMVAYARGPDDLLPLLVADPRRVSMRGWDGLYLRLVRVEEALVARGYEVTDTLVLDLVDDFCPRNSGRWRLDAGPDGASCVRTGRAADLTITAAALASAYLGDVPPRRLARVGLAVEETPGALARTDRLFAASPLPWCPFEF